MQDLRFRTVTGEEFELPANPSQNISDLIITVQETLNDPKYTNIILIYQGDTLDPSEKVSSIGTPGEEDFILVKNSKRRAKAKKETPPENEEVKSPSFAENEETNLEKTPSSQPVHRRPKRGLPKRDDIEIQRDPPDFKERVDALVELGGFDRKDCEKALRMSFFNPDRASAYLFSGNIPDYPQPEVYSRPRKSVNKESGENSNNANQVDDDNSRYEQLNQEQKELIILVMRDTGKDFGQVLQTAVACDFNENNLRNCLKND